MRLVSLLAVLAATAGAQAQAPVVDAARFTPLHVGDVWQYTVSEYRTATPLLQSYRVNRVSDVIVVGATLYLVLTSQVVALDGSPTGAATTCAFSPESGPAPVGVVDLPNYSCATGALGARSVTGWYGLVQVIPASAVTIGAQSVQADSVLTLSNSFGGSGGAVQYRSEAYATDIGWLSTRLWGRKHWAMCQTDPADCVFDTRTELTFARIGGRTFGAMVVAGEVTPGAAAAFALTISPNPSSEAFQINASGVTGRVDVDVFDTLGRRVDGGTASASAPFTFRPGAAGVYVVRARDEAGHVAVRRVVRR